MKLDKTMLLQVHGGGILSCLKDIQFSIYCIWEYIMYLKRDKLNFN